MSIDWQQVYGNDWEERIWDGRGLSVNDARAAEQVTADAAALQREHDDGKTSAWMAAGHAWLYGHRADAIEQQLMESNGPTADQSQRTPAEHAWHRGFDAGADDGVSMIREMERQQEMEAG